MFNELFSFSSLPESGNLRDKLRHHTHVFRLYESATINVFVILPLWFEFSASSYFSKISPLQWRWRLSSASLRDVTYVVMTQSRVCFRLKSTLLCVWLQPEPNAVTHSQGPAGPPRDLGGFAVCRGQGDYQLPIIESSNLISVVYLGRKI